MARNSSVFEWPCPDGGVHQSESALCLVFLKIFSIYFCFLLAAWGSRQQRLKSPRRLLLTRLERDPRSTDDMTTDMTVVAETGPAIKLDLIFQQPKRERNEILLPLPNEEKDEMFPSFVVVFSLRIILPSVSSLKSAVAESVYYATKSQGLDALGGDGCGFTFSMRPMPPCKWNEGKGHFRTDGRRLFGRPTNMLFVVLWTTR